MRLRRLMLRSVVCGTLFAFMVSGVPCAAQTPESRPVADDPEKVAAELRAIAKELNDAVKSFETHLDREIALHDGGYRTSGGQRIPGADADLIGGPASVVDAARRKLFAARMICARRPGYTPAPVGDSDRVQVLIEEARRRINIGNDLARRRMVVSADELNPQADAKERLSSRELLKARIAAGDAAKKAFVALPIALPAADSPEQQREKAWDLMDAKLPAQPGGGKANGTPPQVIAALPIRFEPGKRITLINEHDCRVTLTDSGMEDRQGRHLFYQEEWALRRLSGTVNSIGESGLIVSRRWAIAVNTGTGQHTLLRRYEEREFRGDFDDLYQFRGSDYASQPELPGGSTAPSTQELASAVESVVRSREDLHNAVLDFKRQIRDALTRNDARLYARNKPALDNELPNELRESLFAIRGHLSGTATILDAENKVRRAVEQATGRVRVLEALVAWVITGMPLKARLRRTIPALCSKR